MDEKNSPELPGNFKGSETAKMLEAGQTSQAEHQNFIQAFYALNLP